MFLNLKLQSLNISSTVHNIKRFWESEEVFVLKGPGWNAMLDACDLQAHRQYCIKNMHDSVMYEFRNTSLNQSVNTVHCAIQKCMVKLYHAKMPYLNMIQKRYCLLWAKANLKWSVAKGKLFCGQRNGKCYVLFGNHGCCILRTKKELVISAQFKSLYLWWYGDALVYMEWASCTFGKAPSMLKGTSRF